MLSPSQNCRLGRYWIASARCAVSVRSLAARSAIVRAGFRNRWYARAAISSCCIAARNSARAAPSSAQEVRTSAGTISHFVSSPALPEPPRLPLLHSLAPPRASAQVSQMMSELRSRLDSSDPTSEAKRNIVKQVVQEIELKVGEGWFLIRGGAEGNLLDSGTCH